jgi:hypothetical protein
MNSRESFISIVNDNIDELAEIFQVGLSGANGAAITDATGVGTIVDNDRNGTFSCSATALRAPPRTPWGTLARLSPLTRRDGPV